MRKPLMEDANDTCIRLSNAAHQNRNRGLKRAFTGKNKNARPFYRAGV
jgi:hypothetical protein